MLKCVVCGRKFSRPHHMKRITCSLDCLELLRIINTKKYHFNYKDRLVWNRTKVDYPIDEKYKVRAYELVKKWHLPER